MAHFAEGVHFFIVRTPYLLPMTRKPVRTCILSGDFGKRPVRKPYQRRRRAVRGGKVPGISSRYLVFHVSDRLELERAGHERGGPIIVTILNSRIL